LETDRLLGGVDVDLALETLEFVCLGEFLQALLEVFLAQTDPDALGLRGDGGVTIAVVTFHLLD